jgi:uncharacterized membrane protein
MLPLVGLLLVVAGFALRLNPLLVVVGAGLATGLLAGQAPGDVLATLGRAFLENRYVAAVWLVVPVVGVLERAGLREHARALVARLRGATPGRVLLAYFALRQATAALGLTSLGGHPQMVRPLVAPMAEGAAERAAGARGGALDGAARRRVRAHAAAADNVGLFFGEDIFIAIGSILLIKGFLEQNGVRVEPARLALWAVPTALAALAVHGARLLLLDRRLARAAGAADAPGAPPDAPGGAP